MSKNQKCAVFLTGGSSGIGRATLDLLLAEGYEVWATSRDVQRLPLRPGLHPLRLDFQEEASVREAWDTAVRQSGGIDVLIQNAGRGWFGSIEETADAAARAQWVDLVEGPLGLFRLAAAHMRVRQKGMIVGVSSLAAEMPMPFFSHYSAGKAALSVLLAGLWMELRPFGVRVVDLRPGDIRTAFNEWVVKSNEASSVYAKEMEAVWEESCRLLASAPEPAVVGREILLLLGMKHPPAVRRCGPWFQAGLASRAGRVLPSGIMLRLIRRYYGL